MVTQFIMNTDCLMEFYIWHFHNMGANWKQLLQNASFLMTGKFETLKIPVSQLYLNETD